MNPIPTPAIDQFICARCKSYHGTISIPPRTTVRCREVWTPLTGRVELDPLHLPPTCPYVAEHVVSKPPTPPKTIRITA